MFVDQANAATYWASGVYMKLACDIDLAGRPYTTAVIASDTDNTNSDFEGIPFRGIFDGNNYIIENLTINTAGADNDFLGLFGYIEGPSAQIKNLGIENINITGGDNSRFLGGLCGYNCDGTITNCYATGSVTGDDRLGGLCGYNYYGWIINCFWDVETGGPDNGLGSPKTTAEMQTESTFTDVGWDFFVVPVWRMPFEVVGYPMLGWQKDIPGDFAGSYGVNMVDLAAILDAWLSDDTPTANWNEDCDLDDSGVIDTGDLKIFAENWLAGK